ncbi:MAG: adenosylcobinamide-GDP ribazoletransferase [Candidatus Omnitrophica bacterium]|nr:adenosylcobinamide-GDP ribazoletransferase [Candidatus Omnitrophota bacterium]
MRSFFLALQFLTIFPIKHSLQFESEDFKKALYFFPLIGMIIGSLLTAFWLMLGGLPVLARTVLLVGFNILLSGALHIDAFADTCDGLYGFHSKEKALRIMRESRIGVMGAAAIVWLLISKIVFISGISQTHVFKVLFCLPVFSRWVMSFACCNTAYARKEGKAKLFIENANPKVILLNGVLIFGLFVFSWRLKGAMIFLLSLLCVYIYKQYVQKRIEGMSGDTVGAANEISEWLILFFVLLIL